MAGYFIWSTSTETPPQTIGNATLSGEFPIEGEPKAVALAAGVDIDGLRAQGLPAWAAAYDTPDEDPFDPGSDADAVAGYTDVPSV
jgi:hypothetical protein